MNKQVKTKIALGGVFLALAIVGSVYADMPPDHSKAGDHCKSFSKKGPHDALPPFLKGIELSKDQQAQISALIKQDQPSMETHHQQRGALMKNLHDLSSAETFNEKQAEAIASQFATLEKEEFLDRARNDHKIFSLLTPDQRQKVNQNIKKHMGEMDNMKIRPVEHAGFNKKLPEISMI